MLDNYNNQMSHIHKRKFLEIVKNLFIQSKTTPNPNFMKFIPTGKTIMETGFLSNFENINLI